MEQLSATNFAVLGKATGAVQFLNEATIVYPTGNGLVLHDTESGSQRCIWNASKGSGNAAGSTGPAVVAVCPEQQMLAHAQPSGDTVHFVGAADLHVVGSITDASQNEWLHLTMSKDGSRLLSIGGFPHHHLDLWDLTHTSPEPIAPPVSPAKRAGQQLVTTHRHVARVALGSLRLCSLGCAAFALNANVVVVCGEAAARVVVLDPVPQNDVVRQADVDLSCLREDEQLRSFCWTPNGSLLLGTSSGRLLAVRGAAPQALPGVTWVTPLVAVPLLDLASVPPPSPGTAVLAAGAAEGSEAAVPAARGAQGRSVEGEIVHVAVMANHVALLASGGASNPTSHLVWLDAGSPSDPAHAVATPIPGVRHATCAALSPSQRSFVVLGSNGALMVVELLPPSPPLQPTTPALSLLLSAGTPRGSISTPSGLRGVGADGSVGGAGSRLNPASRPTPRGEDSARSSFSFDAGLLPTPKPRAMSGSVGGAATPAALPGSGPSSVSGAAPPRPPPTPTLNCRPLAHFHPDRVVASCMLPGQLLVTAGDAGTLHVWRCSPHDLEHPATAGMPVAATTPTGAATGATGATGSHAAVLAVCDLGQPITAMVACRRAGQTSQEVLVGTKSGVLMVVLIHTHPLDLATPSSASADPHSHGPYAVHASVHIRTSWEMGIVEGPVNALALNAHGDCAAAACSSKGVVAFLKVSNMAADITLQPLGFYQVKDPRVIAFAPASASTGSTGPAGTSLTSASGASSQAGAAATSTSGNSSMGGGYSLYAGGAAPLLVIASVNGEVLVLQAPERAYTATWGPASSGSAGDAIIPAGSLTRGFMRVQAKVTALTTAAPGGPRISGTALGFGDAAATPPASPTRRSVAAASAAAAGGSSSDGSFWVFAACADKSVRRFRMLTDAQKAAVKTAHEPPKHALMAAQAYQAAETERPLDLPMSANTLQLCSGARTLVAGCLDGSVVLYSVPDLACQGRWAVHDPSAGGCTAALLQDSTLVTAGGDGVVTVMEVKSAVAAAAAAAARRTSRVRGGSVMNSPAAVRNSAHGVDLTPGSAGVGSVGAKPWDVQGVVVPPHLSSPVAEVQVGTAAAGGKVLTWREARAAGQALAHAGEIERTRTAVASAVAKWRAQLRELKQRNDAVEDPSERLSPEEFIVDTSLVQQLRTEADARAASASAAARITASRLEVLTHRLQRVVGVAGDLLEAPQQELLSMPEHVFVSWLSAEETRRFAAAAPIVKVHGVSSYPLRRLTKREELVMRKVSFLRRVEQAEWAQRPVEERGQVVTVKAFKGRMAGRFSLSDTPLPPDDEEEGEGRAEAVKQLDGKAAGGGGAVARGGEDDEEEEEDGGHSKSTGGETIEGNQVHNGACGLLYSSLQLQTPGRKAMQAMLVQMELRELQRAFNARFKQVHEVKHKEIERAEERLARVVEIQKALDVMAEAAAAAAAAAAATASAGGPAVGAAAPATLCAGTGATAVPASPAPGAAAPRASGTPATAPAAPAPAAPLAHYGWSPVELGFDALLEVKDEEVTFGKWVSPEERARREADAAEAERQRRKAEADDMAQRALREMMHGALESKAGAGGAGGKAGAQVLEREPWMDLPRHQLTKEQRQQLIEWEKRAAEAAEEEEKQRRRLEAERKLLEFEVAEGIIEFNNKLAALLHAKVKVDEECRSWELQALDCALSVDLVQQVAQRKRRQQELLLTTLTMLRDKRGALLPRVQVLVDRALRQYEELSPQEKQLDKAFRREFGIREELYEDLSRVYRDRRKAVTGLPVRSAAELLSKVPEGQQHGAAGAGSGHASRASSPSPVHLSPQQSMVRAHSTHSSVLPGPPGPAAPDEQLPPPPLMRQLRNWASDASLSAQSIDPLEAEVERLGLAGALSLAGAPSLARFQSLAPNHSVASHKMPKAGGGSAHVFARLQAMSAGAGRPMEPLLQAVMAGMAPDKLAATSEANPLGLGLPDMLSRDDPFSSLSLRTLFQPGAAAVSAASAAMAAAGAGNRSMAGTEDSVPLSEAPWDTTSKPEGVEEAWWARLLEMRDTRIDVEQEADGAWTRACHLAAALHGLERDHAAASDRLDQLHGARVALRRATQRWDLDVLLRYTLTNGQVDIPDPLAAVATGAAKPRASSLGAAGVEGGTVADSGQESELHGMQHACLLRQIVVEGVNSAVQHRGMDKLELLEGLKRLQADIYLAQWENQQSELRTVHAQEELRDMQLLHTTKELQMALHDPSVLSKADSEARMVKLLDGAASSHQQRVDMRRDKLLRMTERVAETIESHEDITHAERQAEAAYKESERVHEVTARNRAALDADQKRHLRALVTNAQLKAIAKEQAAELERLAKQLDVAKQRAFPILVPPSSSPTWSTPDLSRAVLSQAAAVQPRVASASPGKHRAPLGPGLNSSRPGTSQQKLRPGSQQSDRQRLPSIR